MGAEFRVVKLSLWNFPTRLSLETFELKAFRFFNRFLYISSKLVDGGFSFCRFFACTVIIREDYLIEKLLKED